MNETKEKIITNLEELPNEIVAKEKKLIELVEESEELQLLNKSIETRLKAEIRTEEVETVVKEEKVLKKAFKNDAERDRELDIRLRDNEQHRDNSINLTKIKKESKELELGIKFLSRKFRAFEAIARLGTE